MKNKRLPINKMRLMRRIYRLSALLACLPLSALAIIMVYHYVDKMLSVLYFAIVTFTPLMYIMLRDSIVDCAKVIWQLTDD